MNIRTFIASLGIFSLASTFMVGSALADSTTVVRPTDMASSFADVSTHPNAWFFYNDENDTIDNTLGSFVSGPNTPPYGTGSVQISVSGTQRRNLATYQFSGTPLAAITTLAYSTYNPSVGNGGSTNRAGYLQFNVDFNGSDTWQKRMIFLPADNGTIVQDSWQQWDALQAGSALWRYSGTVWPGSVIAGSTPRTWNDILTSYPGVRVRVTDSWLGIRVGEPYPDGYTENIDGVKFATAAGGTTFDFEPAAVHPTTKDECKHGGWKTFTNPSFKNQGQCVSWVEKQQHDQEKEEENDEHEKHEHEKEKHAEHEHSDHNE